MFYILKKWIWSKEKWVEFVSLQRFKYSNWFFEYSRYVQHVCEIGYCTQTQNYQNTPVICLQYGQIGRI